MKSRHGQNIIEISLLAVVLVVVAISVMTIYNNQKLKIARMSDSHVSANANEGNSTHTNKSVYKPNNNQVGYNRSVETAGALSLIGMNATEFSALLAKLTYDQLTTALSQGSPDMLELANKLGANINGDSVDASTVEALVQVLNDVAAVPESARSQEQNAYVDRFNALIAAVKK